MAGKGFNVFFLVFLQHPLHVFASCEAKPKENKTKPSRLHKIWLANNSKIKLYFSN